MTDVPDLVKVTVAAPLGSFDHSPLATTISMAQAVRHTCVLAERYFWSTMLIVLSDEKKRVFLLHILFFYVFFWFVKKIILLCIVSSNRIDIHLNASSIIY